MNDAMYDCYGYAWDDDDDDGEDLGIIISVEECEIIPSFIGSQSQSQIEKHFKNVGSSENHWSHKPDYEIFIWFFIKILI